jgi:diguanylate cyclase (GGDEF)-like protein
MANWMPLNKALSEGKVPKGVLAKSIVFAAMSPNTPVDLQEAYYGHYIDMLNEGKVDPFKPMSDDQLREFQNRATGGQFPTWNRDHYVHATKFAAADGTSIADDGEAPAVGELPQIQGLRNAHLLYPYLEHLTARHKDDTQGIAGELMDMKDESNRYNSAFKRQAKVGKLPKTNAPEQPRILGYGPKLTRYLLGMMGGGNMIVPDRHMVRSTFDLHQEHDADMLEKLQTGVVTNSKNEPFLRAIDHNFFVKHPAVKHVLETFPKHFAGREQQATFPAFWLHWLCIGHHDRLRGRPSMAFNGGTDHGVFWDSVKDEMIKHGLHPHPIHDGVAADAGAPDPDTSFDFGENLHKAQTTGLDPWPRHHAFLDQPVWLKAMGATEALRMRHGENPALFAYFAQIHHKVMDAETPVPPVTHAPHPAYHAHMFKAEALLINLRKALGEGGEKEHPALDEVAPHIHHVYAHIPGPDLKINRHPTGRFLTAGNHVHILEDYHGHLKGALSEGPIDHWKTQQIENLRNSHKLEVVPLSDIRSGTRPELWQHPQVQAQQARPKAFEYLRQGQEKADHLEYINGQAHLNGHPLDREQTQALLHHVKNGHAVVRYKEARGAAIQKMELVITELMKGEDPAHAARVHEALGKLDELVKAGHLEPHHAEALRQHAFKDPMTGHVMGNKFAYTDFKNRSEAKGGIHLAMDGNDFKSVNDKFGHETGDQAIKAMGTAMREAMDETVGPEQGKLFRVGGDEFAAHVPTHEHAAAFSRALRNKLEAITPIQGTHRLSMGIGLGVSPEHADKALYEAKKQKYIPEGMTNPDSRKWVSKYTHGETPSLAHSLVPGFEGPVPLDHQQLTVKPPPAPQPLAEAPAPAIHTPPGSAPAQAPAPKPA